MEEAEGPNQIAFTISISICKRNTQASQDNKVNHQKTWKITATNYKNSWQG